MRSEASVKPTSRYLWLAGQLSQSAFDAERRFVIGWCAENSSKMQAANREALRRLVDCRLDDQAIAAVTYGCYADIPAGRVFSAVFDTHDPQVGETTEAIIQFAVFFRRLPMLSLEHGHHHLVVISFPVGLPKLIESLTAFDPKKSPTQGSVGLCDYADWAIISKNGTDA